MHRAGQPFQIAHGQAVHGPFGHAVIGQSLRMRSQARPEQRPAFDLGRRDVFGDRFGRREVDALGLHFVALELGTQRCLIAILMEVRTLQLAASCNARADFPCSDTI